MTDLLKRSTLPLVTFVLCQLVLTFWWLAYYPGLMSYDSVSYVWHVTSDNWMANHSVPYDILVWLSIHITDDLGLLTLLQTVGMSLALAYGAGALRDLGVSAWLAAPAAVATTILPATGTFVIFIWKDVPFTIGAVLAFAATVKIIAQRRAGALGRRPLALLFLGFLCLVLFRNNGFLTALIVAPLLIALLPRIRTLVAIVTVVPIMISFFLTGWLYPKLDIEGARPSLTYASAYADVAVAYVKRPDTFTAEDLALMSTAGPLSTWAYAGSNCYNSDWLTSNDQFDKTAADAVNDRLVALWKKVLLRTPEVAIKARLCRGSIAWSPWPGPSSLMAQTLISPTAVPADRFGWAKDEYSRMTGNPFVPKLTTRTKWKAGHDFAESFYETTRSPGWEWLLWRGATWCYLAYAAMLIFAIRNRFRAVAALPALVVGLQLSVLAANPAQLFRYMAAPIFIGLLLLPLAAARARPEGERQEPPTTKLWIKATATAVVVLAASLTLFALRPGPAAPKPPPGLAMQVVAHPGDDLAFMNPDVSQTIAAGNPVVTVYLGAGQRWGTGATWPDKARDRQRRSMAAYAKMAGVADAWDYKVVKLRGRVVERYTLTAKPQVKLFFFNLQEGRLEAIWRYRNLRVVVPTGSKIKKERFSHRRIVQVLTSLMNTYGPTVIRMQDISPGRIRNDDRVTAAKFTSDAMLDYKGRYVTQTYRDANVSQVPANLGKDQVTAKTDILKAFGSTDTRYAGKQVERWPGNGAWAGKLQDGRIALFSVISGQPETSWQRPDGSFTGPFPLPHTGRALAPSLSVVSRKDGRLQLFAHRLSDHHLLSLTQTAPNGGWEPGWTDLGSPNPGVVPAPASAGVGSPAAAVDDQDRIHLYVKNLEGRVSVRVGNPDGTWGAWTDIGGSAVQDGLSAVTVKGKVELFGSTKTDPRILHWVQDRIAGTYGDKDDVPTGPPHASLDEKGKVQVTYPAKGRLKTVGKSGDGDYVPNLGQVRDAQGVVQTFRVGPDAKIYLLARDGASWQPASR
jgi:LmbE family N-acetylglucosaminyl deacetylase